MLKVACEAGKYVLDTISEASVEYVEYVKSDLHGAAQVPRCSQSRRLARWMLRAVLRARSWLAIALGELWELKELPGCLRPHAGLHHTGHDLHSVDSW